MPKRSTFDVIIANLNQLKEREATLKELRALEIAEIPYTLGENAALRDIIQLYRKYMPLTNTDISASDRIQFCKIIAEHNKENLRHILVKSDVSTIISAVAYVKNQYSLEALAKLCKHITVHQEHVFSSFGELCDDIESGDADACIIPIENTTDGKLVNFYSIIDRYELKILSTCEIESSDGNQVTRYALLKRNIVIPNSERCCIELTFVSTQANTLKDMIEISSLLGLSVHRIDSLPLRYNKSSFEISSVLYGTLDDIMTFILFLKLNIPQHTILGLYNNV